MLKAVKSGGNEKRKKEPGEKGHGSKERGVKEEVCAIQEKTFAT